MLAISQSGENYYYLNWVPSEAGPMVTQHGSIKKELENPDKIDEHYYEVLDEIFSNVKNTKRTVLKTRFFQYFEKY